MQDFKDKVAVVTGAASGIGRGLVERFAAEGMKVVLSDIEQESLAQVESEMRDQGATVLAVQTDVSGADQVESLARKTLDAFGAVHILCNNAGVIDMADRPVWETPLNVLEWVMGVNVWGVIHGLRSFIPVMLEQDTDCHVVNTASIAGLLANGEYGLYNPSKHAVVALSETTHLALHEQQVKVKVSVLCPGFVNTRLIDAGRNQPIQPQDEPVEAESRKQDRVDTMRRVLQVGMPPAQVADHVVTAIREERFYILPHPEFKPEIQRRMEDILQERNPGL
jgi:NAD(P)-dependent dehydrogenase (short-subunit alcohol dehydrogenase family)